MLLALETAIGSLLKSALPTLFTGAGAATAAFQNEAWDVDPLSADPVAGEPGPEDAVDDLPFNPALPLGPYTLTRTPYQGPKRVYLKSSAGELVALSPAEVVWNPLNASSFTLVLRPGRDASGFDHLRILYGVVSAATHLKTKHRVTLQLAASDEPTVEKVLALSLSVLAMNHGALMNQGGFAWMSPGYQAGGVIKTLKFVSGASPTSTTRTLDLIVEIDMRVERLLGVDEGKPIAWILSPGKLAGGKSIDLDPAVEA
jgi:hypothetical protein